MIHLKKKFLGFSVLLPIKLEFFSIFNKLNCGNECVMLYKIALLGDLL